jgi:DNA-binding MarR family transcriptional regulator
MIRSDYEDNVTLSHLLNRVARLYSARVVSELQEHQSLRAIRPVHLVTMMHLTGEGQRITEVADELSVSKQAVKRVVDELEEQKYVERTSDPSDRRAKIVKLTRKGINACDAGKQTLLKFEERYASEMGKAAVEKLWSSLITLSDWLDELERHDAGHKRARA